jgi:hypothetical protein
MTEENGGGRRQAGPHIPITAGNIKPSPQRRGPPAPEGAAMTDDPVLLGVLHEDGVLVLCPWCREIHTHGRGDGHRLAHCLHGPRRGYYIREAAP